MDSSTLEKAKKSIRDRFGFDMNAEENVNVVQFVHIRLVSQNVEINTVSFRVKDFAWT